MCEELDWSSNLALIISILHLNICVASVILYFSNVVITDTTNLILIIVIPVLLNLLSGSLNYILLQYVEKVTLKHRLINLLGFTSMWCILKFEDTIHNYMFNKKRKRNAQCLKIK